jgi:hypothetical protein
MCLSLYIRDDQTVRMVCDYAFAQQGPWPVARLQALFLERVRSLVVIYIRVALPHELPQALFLESVRSLVVMYIRVALPHELQRALFLLIVYVR